MQEITFEQVLSDVQSLSPESRARLRDVLNKQEVSPTVAAPVTNGTARKHDPVNEMARAASLRDLTAEHRWLKEHCDEYAGQWVALKGDQLISHGVNAKEVYLTAKAAGHMDALMEKVEPSNALPFIF
ncbi:MAG: DUF5678 domain-containing protein [Blastocatellia bacterium]